jgi:hypothetical protein
MNLLPGPHYVGPDLVTAPTCGILNGLLVAEAAGSFAYQPPCCEKPAPRAAHGLGVLGLTGSRLLDSRNT